jgi:hypothetical protein
LTRSTRPFLGLGEFNLGVLRGEISVQVREGRDDIEVINSPIFSRGPRITMVNFAARLSPTADLGGEVQKSAVYQYLC